MIDIKGTLKRTSFRGYLVSSANPTKVVINENGRGYLKWQKYKSDAHV